MAKLSRPDGIIFDCDSTLSKIEGIDELAKLKNEALAVKNLTNQAMDGDIPLEEVYSKRLDIIQPKRVDLQNISQQYIDEITDGALDFVRYLKASHIHIAIISGGIRAAIIPLAKHLGIQEDDVYAVDLQFDAQGNYEKIIPSPLTTSCGKKEIARIFKKKYHLNNVYLIGDGMSDVAAKGPDGADLIIGYGGVTYREKVAQSADLYHQSNDLSTIQQYWGN